MEKRTIIRDTRRSVPGFNLICYCTKLSLLIDSHRQQNIWNLKNI